MTSREGSTGRPPGGTESNTIIQSPTMKAFPEIPDELNHSQAEADGSINQSMASATDYLQSMTMNEWCEILHSETNQSYLLDQVIDNAMDVLSENAKSFEKVTQSMFDDGDDDGFVVT